MTERQFNRVWVPLQERFYRVAYHLLEDREDALDAVQDLYVKLWNMRDVLDLVQNPASYGCLMTRNLCIDHIRKTRPAERARVPVDTLDSNSCPGAGNQAVRYSDNPALTPAGQAEASPSPDSILTGSEDLQALLGAIRALPSSQGKVLEMRVFQGMKNSEIAAATGLSPLSVRVRLSQARSTIKKTLKI